MGTGLFGFHGRRNGAGRPSDAGRQTALLLPACLELCVRGAGTWGPLAQMSGALAGTVEQLPTEQQLPIDLPTLLKCAVQDALLHGWLASGIEKLGHD